MAQWLRVPAALAENPGSISSTHIMAQNDLFPGDLILFLTSAGTSHTNGVHTHM